MASYTDFSDPNTFSFGQEMAPLQAAAVKVQTNAAPSYSPVSTSTNATNGAAASTNGGATTGKTGFFQEGGGASLALGAIQTLGSLWNSFQQNKLAKKSFALQERAFETNLKNQTQTYNTALEDRINARYATEGRSSEAAGYIERNKL